MSARVDRARYGTVEVNTKVVFIQLKGKGKPKGSIPSHATWVSTQ